MNALLFLAALALLSIVFFILSVFVSKKSTSTTDYFLAGKSLGLLPVTFTLIATQLGGGMLLGTAQEAYQVGIFGILYTLGITMGFLLLGSGIAARLQQLNVATTAEIFQTHYHSIFLKKIASLLSIATLFGIFIGQIIASKTIIATLDTYQEPIFLLFWLLIILCTVQGGLQTIVITDTFQVMLIIGTFITIVLYSIFHDTFSLSWNTLAALQHQFIVPKESIAQLVMILLMPALFALIEQDLAQRFFAARNQRIASLAALCAGIFMILFSCVPIYLGMKAKLLGIVLPIGSSPLIPVIAQLTNDIVIAIVLCSLIAAITSTADSLLCAISSNIVQDFNIAWLTVNTLRTSKIITLCIGLSALCLSYIMPHNIIHLLIGSYELSVCSLLVPLLYAYFRPRVKKQAAYASICVGFFSFLGVKYWHTQLPKELIPLLLSWVSYVITDKFSK